MSVNNSQTLAMTRVSLGSLVPDPSNARLHGPENLEAIAASLKRFGQTEPLIIQKATRRIIGGNGRHRAMQQLGWTECNIIEVDCDNLEATSLAIALNRTAELATWDNATLTNLLSTLRTENALDGVGFDTNQIDDLLAELKANEPRQVDDPGPGDPPAVPVSRKGDLWVLGDHRLLCGDSTNASDVDRLLNGKKPVLFSCDPPYCVKYDGNNRPIHDGKRSGKDWSAVYHEVDIADLSTFLSSVFDAYIPRIHESAPFYIWHAHLQQPNIAKVFEKHNILFHQVIVWCKPTPVFTHCYYQWQHEVCAFGWIKGNKPQHGIAQNSTVWHVDWEGKQRIVGNEHPCLHPEASVLTSKGFLPIRVIAIGDCVLSADGKFHEVVDRSHHRYQSPDLIQIEVAGISQTTLASDNHPFLIARENTNTAIGMDASWVRADEIEIGDFTMTPVCDTTKTTIALEMESQQFHDHDGVRYQLRPVIGVARVPYHGDVYNLSVEGNPTFQTAVGMSHNTQKPIKLFSLPMELHTKPGDVVVEAFSGSGSQLIAAETTARKCYAMEIEPTFIDVAVERWQKATGKVAILEATNQTFEQVAAERKSQ